MFLQSRAKIPASKFAPSRQPARLLLPRDTSFWTSRFVGASTGLPWISGRPARVHTQPAGEICATQSKTGMPF